MLELSTSVRILPNGKSSDVDNIKGDQGYTFLFTPPPKGNKQPALRHRRCGLYWNQWSLELF